MSLTRVSYSMINGAVYNALDFGAKGDGVTDDTQSIQDALDQANADGGGQVYLPSGTYLTTDSLQVYTACALIGENRIATVIKHQPLVAGIAIKAGLYPTAVLQYGMRIENLTINLNTDGSTAMYVSGSVSGCYRNIAIEPYDVVKNMTGIKIDGSDISGFYNTFENINANHCHIGYHHVHTGLYPATQSIFINCSSGGDLIYGDTTSIGILHEDFAGETSCYYGGNLESCGTGIKFNGTVRLCKFFGVRQEANTKDLDMSANSAQNAFFGCDILAGKLTMPNGENTIVGGTGGRYQIMDGLLDLSRGIGRIKFPDPPYFDGDPNTLEYYGKGTFTATATGFTTTITKTFAYVVIGDIVTLKIIQMSGTSNSTSFTITGLPTAIIPDDIQVVLVPVSDNSGAPVMAQALVLTDGTIDLKSNLNADPFTASGTKQVRDCTITYIKQQT